MRVKHIVLAPGLTLKRAKQIVLFNIHILQRPFNSNVNKHACCNKSFNWWLDLVLFLGQASFLLSIKHCQTQILYLKITSTDPQLINTSQIHNNTVNQLNLKTFKPNLLWGKYYLNTSNQCNHNTANTFCLHIQLSRRWFGQTNLKAQQVNKSHVGQTEKTIFIRS